MGLVFKDRVKQTSTTNGTSNVVMTGTVAGFQTFANALADADTTYYCIVDGTNDTFEVGLGTWAESTSTLTRTTILESSNSNNAVNFSGSVDKEVFITYPAEKAVFLNANDKLVVGGVEYLSATTNRWHKKLPSSGVHVMSSASGNDDNGNALSFSGDQVDVFVNGVRLSKDAGDYTLGTNSVNFASNLFPSNDDIVEIVSYNIFSGSYGDSNVDTHLNQSSASSGQVLSWNGSDYAWIATGAGNLSNVVEDSSPQLGGNLDINGNDIVSTSNANIEILPNGTGKVHLDGDGSTGGILASDGLLEIKTGSGSVAEMRFYCESSNAHYVALKSPAHSSYSGNVTLTLPSSDGSSGEYLKTDGSGVLSWDTPSGGSSGNTDILTIETTSSLPSSVAQDTVVLYEHASSLYLRSYRGNGPYVAFGVINSTGTTVANIQANGDIQSTSNMICKKFIADGDSSNAGLIEIQQANGSNHIGLQAPSTISNTVNYILPEDGSSGQYLKTDGSGNLSWGAGGGAWEVVQTRDATAGNAVSSMEFTVENDYMYQFLISVQASSHNEQLECQYAILTSGSPNYTAFNTYYTQFKFPSSGGISSTSNGSGSNTSPDLTLDGVLRNASTTVGNMGTPCTGIYNWHQTNQRSDSGYAYTLQRNGTGWFDYMNGTDGNRGFTMHRNITTDEIVRIKFKMTSGNMLGTIRQIRSAM